MLEYSILEDIPKKDRKKRNVVEPFMNDYATHDSCYYKAYNAADLPFCKKEDVSRENFNNKNSCEPLKAPQYEFPISNESKLKFKEAIDVSMNENNSYKQLPNDYNNKTDVKPYYNDDIDMYLNISEIKKTPEIIVEEKKEIIEDNTSQILNKLYNLKNLFIEKKDDEKPQKIDNNVFYKIMFFVLIGLLIILLCDQIANLAINIGMKRAYLAMDIHNKFVPPPLNL